MERQISSFLQHVTFLTGLNMSMTQNSREVQLEGRGPVLAQGLVGTRVRLTSLAESEVLSLDLLLPCSSFPFPPHQRQTGSASTRMARVK